MDFYIWKANLKLSDSSYFSNGGHDDDDVSSEDPEQQELIGQCDDRKKRREKKEQEEPKKRRNNEKKNNETKGKKRKAEDDGTSEERPTSKKSKNSVSQKERLAEKEEEEEEGEGDGEGEEGEGEGEAKKETSAPYFNYMEIDPATKLINSCVRKVKIDGETQLYIPLRFHYKQNDDGKYKMVPEESSLGQVVWIKYNRNFDRYQFERNGGGFSDQYIGKKAAEIENDVILDPSKFQLVNMKEEERLQLAQELGKAVKNKLYLESVPFIDHYHANTTLELIRVSSDDDDDAERTCEYKK